jgi:hypothetical protein
MKAKIDREFVYMNSKVKVVADVALERHGIVDIDGNVINVFDIEDKSMDAVKQLVSMTLQDDGFPFRFTDKRDTDVSH